MRFAFGLACVGLVVAAGCGDGGGSVVSDPPAAEAESAAPDDSEPDDPEVESEVIDPEPGSDDTEEPAADSAGSEPVSADEVLAALADPPAGLDDCLRNRGGFGLSDLGAEPDDYEASVIADCLEFPLAPADGPGDESAGPEDEPGDEPAGSNGPDASGSPFAALGEPGNARECLAAALVGDGGRGVEVEGDLISGAIDVADGYAAWVECVGIPTLFDGSDFASTTDLGYPITFDTPGIIAMPMDDPGYFGRPRGIETLADPSAVLLPDGRVAIYFAGDHRAAGQSTRWVTTSPVDPASPSLEFAPESDYNLLTRTSWRNILRLDDGDWVAFGLENITDGLSRWTSSDGLAFGGRSQVYSPSTYDADLDALGRVVPSREGVPNSAVTVTSAGYFAVFEHLREGFEVEGCPPACDVNGDGYESTSFIRVYRSADGVDWTPGAVVTGPSEGEVVELADGVFMLVRPDGVAHFSRDGDSWGFGVAISASHVDVDLGDDVWLGFGTKSTSDGGIPAEITTFDLAGLSDDWFEPAGLENFVALAG